MELFLGSGFHGFVVEEDDEISDRLPSPGSWSKWGIKSQTFSHPFSTDFILIDDDSTLKEEVEIESSINGKRRFVCSDESAASADLDPFFGGDAQPEDPFLNSFFDWMPQTNITPDSFFCSSPSHGDQVSSEDFFLSMNVNSPSWSREEEDDLPKPCTRPEKIESELIIIDSPGDETMISSEELILQELETILSTFPKKTRICFRDALYRLAQNSRNHSFLHDERISSNLLSRLLFL